ncbi:hypothetical protein JXC34_07300 [Candidatus Woesearchaeota archaeon]|nr:hypothetical protein [Candidatus Woesearchaeota archaeon]
MDKNIDRTRYVCSNCKYEFTRKSSAEVSRCPYCAKQNSVRVKSNNYASEVLDEVSRL